MILSTETFVNSARTTKRKTIIFVYVAIAPFCFWKFIQQPAHAGWQSSGFTASYRTLRG